VSKAAPLQAHVVSAVPDLFCINIMRLLLQLRLSELKSYPRGFFFGPILHRESGANN
jgi:hypothetical protein